MFSSMFFITFYFSFFFFLLSRPPPISTRPDTLFPYTPLSRSLPRQHVNGRSAPSCHGYQGCRRAVRGKSEEHTSELQSLMRISYAVFCLKKKQHHSNNYRASLGKYTKKRHLSI